MNIDIEKAVEDLTWASVDGQVARAAAAERNLEPLRTLFKAILEKNQTHHELEDQMPEAM